MVQIKTPIICTRFNCPGNSSVIMIAGHMVTLKCSLTGQTFCREEGMSGNCCQQFKIGLDRAIGTAAREMEYSHACPSQQKVLKYFLKGKDTFVSLPTGTGKSLCYFILSMVFDKIRNTSCSSIAVIVSPLIALIKDLVNAMSKRRLHAVYIGSVKEDSETATEICQGKFQLIFTSPKS